MWFSIVSRRPAFDRIWGRRLVAMDVGSVTRQNATPDSSGHYPNAAQSSQSERTTAELSAIGSGVNGTAIIKSSEVYLTALLFIFAFFISGVPRVFTQSAAYSLFISAYGAEAVPYAYIAQALCVPLAGWFYLYAEHRLSIRTLLIASRLAGERAVEHISEHLDADSEGERLGAYAGLIRHGGLEGVILAGTKLIADMNSEDTDRRRFAAAVMQRVGSNVFYRPLRRLLDDTDDGVRTAAIAAVGDPMLDALAVFYDESIEARPLRLATFMCCGAIGTPAAATWLIARIEQPSRELRHANFAALMRCGYVAGPERVGLIKWLIT